MGLGSRVRIGVLVTGLLAVAGCGAGADSSSPVDSSSSPIRSPVATLSLTPSASVAPTNASPGSPRFTLPDGWSEVEVSEAGVQSWATAIGNDNPELAAFIEQQLASGAFERLSYWAFGFEDGRYVGNMNVEQGPAGGLTLDGAEPFLIAQLKQIPNVSDVRSSRVTLPVGEALLVSGIMTTLQASGSKLVQAQRAYVVIRDDVGYIVTFTCLEGRTSCLDDAEAIIVTFDP